MTTVPLRKLVDDDQWEAEGLAGRLSIVAHAAFLRSGFVPYGDEPSSGHLRPSLSRRYTLAQLARRREGASSADDVAVQEVRALRNGDVAFRAYLFTTDGHRRRLCEVVLGAAALAPLLSGRLDDAARAMETGSAGSWLWKALAYWVLPVLHELCRRNNLPVTGFASLPDDAKAEILKRLAGGKDLAMVECTSRQLRRLVAERDGELWKTMYESLDLAPEARRSDEGGSWKKRYLNSRLQPPQQHVPTWPSFRFLPGDEAVIREYLRCRIRHRLWEFELTSPRVRVDSFVVEGEPMESTEPEVEVARGKNVGRQPRKVPRHDFHNKRHGAGAIHSPSSRYKWKHR